MAYVVKLARATVSRALLETSVSLERLSRAMVGDMSFYEEGKQHRTFVGLLSGVATVAPTAKVDERATIIGGVDIGNMAVVERDVVVSGPAVVGPGATLAQGAVLKENVTVEANAIVGQNAIVAPGTTVPAGELWLGAPAAFQNKI
mmetsp:Transcript_20795/g.66935  ORF Transcript_20795/g.66935 Transcript_20795/m.66935 type:complete len:146 (+) Transcript_20795:106-543(+)|eukprot:CAMPEP_0118896916 /NCGR_PEP_ID=MMETSP1166-20130328/4549_1 /TAXON_ID=1104430 /ORGANISM="Chrysoreinhardia sp, Strain CCMP3193" /LENGTH=145 /DNA_ID=CAMNT_0006835975 /DNA_START=105 /DNA_END=542 /DNA_ORIENTATION=+